MVEPVISRSHRLRIVPELVARYPSRSALVLSALMIAGIAEGIGLLGLLPMFELVAGGDGESRSAAAQWMFAQLSAFGIEVQLAQVLAFIVTLIAVKSLLTLAAMNYVGGIIAKMVADLRLEVIEAVMASRWGYMVGQSAGRITNVVTVECMEASSAYRAVCQFLASGFQVVLLLGGAFLISPWVTLLGLLMGIGVSMALGGFLRLSRRSSVEMMRILGNMNARLSDSLRGIKPMKAMGKQDWVRPLLTDEMRALSSAMRRQVAAKYGLTTLREPLTVIVMAVGFYFAVAWGGSSLTELLALGALLYRAAGITGTMQQAYQLIGTSEPYYRSVVAVVNGARAAAETGSAGIQAPLLSQSISLRNVSFAYSDRPVLRDVSIEIGMGRLTALIGPSGGGKSTLADLICKLAEPQEGQILVDGVKLSDIDNGSWRSQIGYVPQDLFLFHDSLRHNVSLMDPSVSDEDVIRSLKQAGAMDFVAMLPQGLDTLIGEQGSLLSGGQRQRVAIARALVRRPKLLVLDEATTALDPQTEAEIIHTVKGLVSEMAVLAISHQPRMVLAADVIYQLAEGKITPTHRDNFIQVRTVG